MKLAFLMQCHKNPKQINMLIEYLNHPNIDFYIHVDKKSDVSSQIIKKGSVIILPEEQRVDVKWGTFSQVQATLNLMNYAYKREKYDFYWLISGQDFPLASADQIISFLDSNLDSNYIDLSISKNNGALYDTNFDKRNQIVYYSWMFKRDFKHRLLKRIWVEITGGYNRTFRVFLRKNYLDFKFYFGSSWWCINGAFFTYVINYLETHMEYVNFFKKSCCPDESFFQTLIMNSDYAGSRREHLLYVDWSESNSSPKTITCKDLSKAFNSGKFFVRKIDMEKDNQVIPEILKRIER